MPQALIASITQPSGPDLRPGAERRRLGWLDALRGIGALCVVFEHVNAHELRGARPAIVPWFSPGLYGVMVFFLVSGYIVPASLERRGSVRGFWVGRLFRLYPLMLVAVVLKISLYQFHVGAVPGDAMDHPALAALAHALMLQDLLGVSSVVNVLWTLSYEMVFYLLLTLLFVVRLHRNSAGFAVGFAVIGLAFGGVLPEAGLSRGAWGVKAVVVVAAVAMVAGLAGAVSGHSRSRVAGAALLGGTAMALLLFNGRARAWVGCTILAAMFTGTVAYRAERRQISRAKAVAAACAVCALALVAGIWHIAERNSGYQMLLYERQWAFSIVLAGATFACGIACRHRRIPPVLAWLGAISYSVYLIHPLLLALFLRLPWADGTAGLTAQVTLTSAFVAALLCCCSLTYRLVESPMQRAGRRIAAWLDARLGPDLPGTRSAPTYLTPGEGSPSLTSLTGPARGCTPSPGNTCHAARASARPAVSGSATRSAGPTQRASAASSPARSTPPITAAS